jgi:hypothetical protein
MLRVHVTLPDSSPRSVTISSSSTVRELKTRLSSLSRQDLSNLFARVDSRVLPDETLLSSLAFPDEDLHFAFGPLPPHRISVSLPGTVEISACYSDATQTQTAIAEIYDFLGLPCPPDSSLVYRDHPLPSNARFGDLDLSEDATLTIQEPPRTLTVHYSPESGRRKTIVGRYRVLATAKRIKDAISSHLHFDPDEVVLLFEGRLLPDDLRLGELNILPNSYLEILPVSSGLNFLSVHDQPQNRIEFRCANGKLVRARFSDTATVGVARSFLSEALGIPIEDISLKLATANDSALLRDVLIPSSPPRPLLIKTWDGRLAKARYTEEATIAKMKEELGKSLSVYPEVIEIPGVANDELLIAELPMAEEGFVAVTRKQVEVTKPLLLKLESGIVVRTNFRLKTTVRKVKEALVNVVGVQPWKIALVWNRKVLPNEELIAEFSLPPNSSINVLIL